VRYLYMAGRIRRGVSFLVRRGKERRVGLVDRRKGVFEAWGLNEPFSESGENPLQRRKILDSRVKEAHIVRVTRDRTGKAQNVFVVKTDRRKQEKK